jgi:tetratricopeptide (TPR) repeat protein
LNAGDVDSAKEGELEALQIFRELGDSQGEAICLVHLGQIAAYVGNDHEASECLTQSLSIAREIKYQELKGVCELVSGELAFDLAEYSQAELWFKRSLTTSREATDRRGEANALRWLGKCALQAGDRASARVRFEESMRTLLDLGMWEELLGCLEDAAELLSFEGAVERSIRVSAAAAKARDLLRLRRTPRAELRHQARIAAYRRAATAAEFNTNWEEGEAWSVDDAILNALAQTSEPVATT